MSGGRTPAGRTPDRRGAGDALDRGTVAWGKYKGERALVLENQQLRAVLLPDWGAKTISLVHRPSEYETLWQNPGERFAPTGYGDPYGAGEFAGFDEMFPTISRCFHESVPWSGVEMPDHGEVWTIPWEVTTGENEVTLSVTGIRFPYRLRKTVTLVGEQLVARYAATNLSGFPLEFIWAAHPLFNASEDMRFIVPKGMTEIINAVPGPTLGGYGQRYAFPEARGPGGTTIRLDRVPRKNPTGYQKYWFSSKVTEGWCILHDAERRLSIALSFPPAEVPWLGMWLNDGGYGGQYNVAPEPATGAMDRVDFSRMWGMGSTLRAGETREWHLGITVSAGSEPSAVGPGGELLR